MTQDTKSNALSSSQARKAVPGLAYIEKILQFFHTHYHDGKLFMEFVKFGCQEKQEEDEADCLSCISWTVLPANRTPQPVSDPDRPFHYMHVAATPTETAGGEPRSADDWQPRANIKKLFHAGKISLQQQDEITKFSETFYVKREYVVACVEHLTNLQLTKQIRAKIREAEQNRRK